MPVQPPAIRFGIAAIFKNEAPYLLEWLAHHRLQGASAFFIADNESTDGTSELLQALADAELIQLLRFPSPPGVKPQLPAYRKLLDLHGGLVDWMAIIDADEFIWPSETGTTIAQWLADQQPSDDVGALALNWAVYGSSGALWAQPGGVTERLTGRAHQAFPANHHFKSLVRPGAVDEVVNPHCVTLKAGFRYAHADGSGCMQPRAGLSERVCWAPFRINHYVIKSWSEYMLRKRPRGTADGPDDGYPAAFFHEHDRNDVVERPSPRQLQRLSEEIDVLRRAVARHGFDLSTIDHLPVSGSRLPPGLLQGALESVDCEEAGIRLTGWALARQRGPLRGFSLDFQDFDTVRTGFQRLQRDDVRGHFPGSESKAGFVIEVPWSQIPKGPWRAPALIGHGDDDIQEALAQGPQVDWSAVRRVNEQCSHVTGHIDHIDIVDQHLQLQGWGLEWKRRTLRSLALRHGDKVYHADSFVAMERPDVVSVFPGADPCCGFSARFALPLQSPNVEVCGINAQGACAPLAQIVVPASAAPHGGVNT